jgi:Cu(I)/Ag(I) efflux system membrane protein CusA/SilA
VRSALVAIITLPIAILLSFIPMRALGLTSNIMSLGGIAIAIGAMVDAAIIMVENAHKQLEHFREEHGREPDQCGADRGHHRGGTQRRPPALFLPPRHHRQLCARLLPHGAGGPAFQAARLHQDLCHGLRRPARRHPGSGPDDAPHPGQDHPGNQEPGQPVPHLGLPAVRQFCASLPVAHAPGCADRPWGYVIPFRRLGKEFMPPLNEGTILFMPTAVPGMSIGEATRILQIQDRLLRCDPRGGDGVRQGRPGRDPHRSRPAFDVRDGRGAEAPRAMAPGMTWEKIIAEMNAKLKTPGMANIFWMPIQTRTEMLTTGFRSVLGVKVFGPDLGEIQNLGVQIEKALTDLPDTRSVFAERTTGGYFLDFTVNRRAAARYGLTVGDVNDVIETAIGGKTIATTVEGRERYPISVRYARDYRGDLDALKRVLVPDAHRGAGAHRGNRRAFLSHRTAVDPDENGQLVGFVFVDVTTTTSTAMSGRLRAPRPADPFPPGYYIQWAGQFEYLKSAEQRLAVVIPFTLLIIFVLIYLNTKSAARTAIVLLAVPFSLVGAFWFLYLLHYNLSVAVWVGLIALAGLDAETGVVMLLYLDHAWDKFQAAGRMNTAADLHDAIIEGAVQRIRPKIMTVCAILFGLLPIMWSPTTQAGADVMKRIAAPMIGGVVTSAVLELLLYPTIYMLWRGATCPMGDHPSPGPRGRGGGPLVAAATGAPAQCTDGSLRQSVRHTDRERAHGQLLRFRGRPQAGRKRRAHRISRQRQWHPRRRGQGEASLGHEHAGHGHAFGELG